MSFTTAALLVTWVAIVVLALGLAGLLRQVSVLTARTDSAAPGGGTRTTRDLVGLAVPADGAAASLRSPDGSIVLFSSPTCAACAGVLDDLARLGLDERLVVVSSGACTGVGERAPRCRCVEHGRELMERLAVPATPYLVALDADGTIRDTLMPTHSADLEGWAPVRASVPVPEEESR